MRRANGNGSVIKLKGKRRRPYCARITEWHDTGTDRVQKRRVIGCYRTRPEAEAALYRYCQGFVEVPENAIPTFGECFSKAMEQSERNSTAATVVAYRRAAQRIADLFPIRIDRVTPLLLQETIDRIAPSYSLNSIKNTLVAAGRAFEYARKMRYITADPSEVVDLGAAQRENGRVRRIFSPAEIEALRASNEPMARQVLVMIYTGMRKGEAMALRLADVDLSERLISIRKSKTAAGVRVIPIAEPIADIVSDLYRQSRSGFLFERNGRPYSDTVFRVHFAELMERLGMDHIPHETRHTFATLLYNAKVDDVATKAIIGHTDIATTHDIYTHESIDNLRAAIAMLS